MAAEVVDNLVDCAGGDDDDDDDDGGDGDGGGDDDDDDDESSYYEEVAASYLEYTYSSISVRPFVLHILCVDVTPVL